MGSSLSCLKPRKAGGAVRSVPERRPVSASELRRPNSSFSASTSFTLEPKRRMSVEVERSISSNEAVVDTNEVLASAAERLLPVAEAEETKDDLVEEIEVNDKGVGDMPVAGSTSDDVGATGIVEKETAVLIDMHVRADKVLVTESSGASKLPGKAPSLESMPESLKDSPKENNSQSGKQYADVKRKKDVEGERDRVKKDIDKGKVQKSRTKELQRSDTMLDVRSGLPVKIHVTNYERIDAEARIDPEELVKSGKYKTEN